MLFKNRYSFLSNMCSLGQTVKIGDIVVRTTENYYQAMKSSNPAIRDFIAQLNPYEAKRIARETKQKEDFNNNKLTIMKDAIEVKFNLPVFKFLLLATNNTKIVEDNYWNDTYWGVCEGVGENNLGKLIMEKRDSLKTIAEVKSKIKIGNMYHKDVIEYYDYICFTSNSTLNKDNELIMGAGTAKVIKDMYNTLPAYFGKEVIKGNNSLIVNNEFNIIAFRTKDNWKEDSKIELIQESLDKLRKFALKNKDKRIALPVPGVTNGNLTEDVILPLLANLPKNVDVWSLPKTNCYTGIGSRTLPEEYGVIIDELAELAYKSNIRLRGGGADGSDNRFENKAYGLKEIYLPWKGFNGNKSLLYTQSNTAETFAYFLHPAFDRLSDPVKKLMARNVYQVIGGDLRTPSDFVACYTKDGCNSHKTRTSATGGTGQAISLASLIGVPVYNVFNKEDYEMLKLQLKSLVKDE